MTEKMLENAYDLEDAEATRDFYAKWAASYDLEVLENGYATPARAAHALADYADDLDAPVLDIGCGTGISGKALKSEGFTTIDGCDFSTEMLEKARRKDVYRNLINTNLENPFPFEQGTYAYITAIGVLNPGHAPAETLTAALDLLLPGGLIVFSLNDHALADKSYEACINEHVDTCNVALLFREYGPHLPKIDLHSNVYVMRKN